MRTLLALILLAALPVQGAGIGAPAPDFSLQSIAGNAVKLSARRGKYVMLERVNALSPYVSKHYRSANMWGLQKELASKNVVWLSINSTRADHYEYMARKDTASWTSRMNASPSATLLNPNGVVGRDYGARTTPHLYIVDPKGALVYSGAIDSTRSADPENIKSAKKYVRTAIGELLVGICGMVGYFRWFFSPRARDLKGFGSDRQTG